MPDRIYANSPAAAIAAPAALAATRLVVPGVVGEQTPHSAVTHLLPTGCVVHTMILGAREGS